MSETEGSTVINDTADLEGQPFEVVENVATGSPTAVADAFLPRNQARQTAIMLIHGGGFRGGSRKTFHGWGAWFASRGYASLVVSYAIASRGNPSYPTPILDAWDHFNFMVSGGLSSLHSRGSVPSHPDVVAIGSSAGATLAAYLNLGILPAPDGRGEAAFQQDRPAAVVCSAGAYDLIQQWEHDQLHNPGNSSKEIYLGGDPMTHRSLYYLASPLFYASRERAVGTRWLFSWGTMDDVCDNLQQSAVMAEHLKRSGAKVRTHPVPGASHYWFPLKQQHDDGSHASAVAARILSFLGEFNLDKVGAEIS